MAVKNAIVTVSPRYCMLGTIAWHVPRRVRVSVECGPELFEADRVVLGDPLDQRQGGGGDGECDEQADEGGQ
jgi:hypothetical protein